MSTTLADLPALVLTAYPSQDAANAGTLAADAAGLRYLIVAGLDLDLDLWAYLDQAIARYHAEHHAATYADMAAVAEPFAGGEG